MGDVVIETRKTDDPIGAREFGFLEAYRVTSIPGAQPVVDVGDILVRLPAQYGTGSGLFNATKKMMVWDHAGFWDRVRGVRDRNVVSVSICFDKG
jgi:hypothetical protein